MNDHNVRVYGTDKGTIITDEANHILYTNGTFGTYRGQVMFGIVDSRTSWRYRLGEGEAVIRPIATAQFRPHPHLTRNPRFDPVVEVQTVSLVPYAKFEAAIAERTSSQQTYDEARKQIHNRGIEEIKAVWATAEQAKRTIEEHTTRELSDLKGPIPLESLLF